MIQHLISVSGISSEQTVNTNSFYIKTL